MWPYIDRSYLTVKTKHPLLETMVFVFSEIILTEPLPVPHSPF